MYGILKFAKCPASEVTHIMQHPLSAPIDCENIMKQAMEAHPQELLTLAPAVEGARWDKNEWKPN